MRALMRRPLKACWDCLGSDVQDQADQVDLSSRCGSAPVLAGHEVAEHDRSRKLDLMRQVAAEVRR